MNECEINSENQRTTTNKMHGIQLNLLVGPALEAHQGEVLHDGIPASGIGLLVNNTGNYIVKYRLSKQFDYTCDVRGKVRQEGRHRGKWNIDERGRDT